FDGVWACGVVHHTGDTAGAIREIHRVLKPGGRAMISHMYRKPSWMYYLSKYGRENIEFKEEDAPITHFVREDEALAMFEGFEIEATYRDHYRCLPVARTGLKAALYTYGFKPLYNSLPEPLAQRLAYKFSVIALKKRPADTKGKLRGSSGLLALQRGCEPACAGQQRAYEPPIVGEDGADEHDGTSHGSSCHTAAG